MYTSKLFNISRQLKVALPGAMHKAMNLSNVKQRAVGNNEEELCNVMRSSLQIPPQHH